MTWGLVTSVENPLHMGYVGPAFFQSKRSPDTYGIASTMQPPRLPSAPPPLVLTALHQREALIIDRNWAAKRMDTQEVHRLERGLRKLTNRILAKGVCSDAKHG